MQLLKRPISISAADCQARGFPPLEIHFDLTGAALMEVLFPGGDSIVTMHGPPGGPYHFSIQLVRTVDGKLPTLEALVKAHDLPRQNFSLAGSGTVEVSGRTCDLICYVVKPTPWADHCAAVLYPLADRRHALLLTFSAGYDAMKGMQPGGSQEKVLKSLKIVEK